MDLNSTAASYSNQHRAKPQGQEPHYHLITTHQNMRFVDGIPLLNVDTDIYIYIWYGKFKVAALNQYKSTDCIACHTQKRTILSAIPFKWFWTNSASNMH